MTEIDISIEAIAAFLISEKVFENVNIHNGSRQKDRLPCLVAEKNILDQKCHLLIEFNSTFPSCLPKFTLKNVADFPLMPHVNSRGVICLFEKDTILVDPLNPLGIVKASSERAFKILEEGISNTNRNEIFQEFEAFLDCIPTCQTAISLLSEGSSPSIVWMTIFDGKPWYGDSKNQLLRFFRTVSYARFSENIKFKRVLYVPLLEDETQKLPLWRWEKWWQLPVLRAVFWRSLNKHGIKWHSFLANRENSELPIIFRLPLPNGGNIHFGITFINDNRGIHPILKRRSDESCFPVKLKRMDKNYLLPRGGANTNLFEKNILLVGCGSVSSCISQNLVKSGIGKITLIDNDDLKPENAYRHLLGIKDSLKQKRKSDLLKIQIESELPNCEVTSISEDFFSILKSSFDFAQFDLIILATGNDNLCIASSEYFHVNFPRKPVIYTWLDPLGIGGHTLLTNLDSHGCYKCIFDNDLHNKVSFAEKGQSFSKTMAGCSGRFTDFSFLDVQETALQTSKISIAVLKKEKTSNYLISWIGDDNKFVSEGYKTSTRFQKNAEKSRLEKSNFANECCSICGNASSRSRIPTLKGWHIDNN